MSVCTYICIEIVNKLQKAIRTIEFGKVIEFKVKMVQLYFNIFARTIDNKILSTTLLCQLQYMRYLGINL